MSGDLTLALRTAQSGLLANQMALGAVANNVANANTPGYSRQVVNLEQRVLAGNGAGVQLAALTRRIDEGLLKSFRVESGTLNAIAVQQSFFQRTQNLFGAPEDNNSLSHTLGRFTQAVESLAVAPQNALEQREMVRWADDVAIQFRQTSAAIQDLRLEADQRIGQAVSEINGLIEQVADLNGKIVRNGATAHSAADLEDQRDRALDRLSQLVDTQVFNRGDGSVVVFTGGGRVLVDSLARPLTHHAAAATTATMTHAGGTFSGIYSGSVQSANDMTTEIRTGELKGLIELRDSILPNLQSTLNTLAGQVRDTVNAVHNRGVAFPGLQEMTGSRIFTDPANQRLSITGDVAIVLFDGNGNAVAETHLSQLVADLDAPLANLDAPPGPPLPPTIDALATALDGWLKANGGAASSVAIDSHGHLVINVADPARHLAFRDEVGGAAGDVTIAWSADGDSKADASVRGFSSFFGLNDFFVGGQVDSVFESGVLGKAFRVSKDTTLTFGQAGGIATTAAIDAGMSLDQIVERINHAPGSGVTATLIPDGAGVRLRITANDARSMTITDGVTGGLPDTFLSDTGMLPADILAAATLAVRGDIKAQPSLVARGAVQANGNGAGNQYFVSVGDDTAIHQLATTLGAVQAFAKAGGLGAVSATFSQYAAEIISENASRAEANASAATFQGTLVDSLKAKSDSVRGVNLDEEMSDLILFEQAYAAAARLIGVIQNMFEALESAVR
jgi:flagellar hook-associated protein 1